MVFTTGLSTDRIMMRRENAFLIPPRWIRSVMYHLILFKSSVLMDLMLYWQIRDKCLHSTISRIQLVLTLQMWRAFSLQVFCQDAFTVCSMESASFKSSSFRVSVLLKVRMDWGEFNCGEWEADTWLARKSRSPSFRLNQMDWSKIWQEIWKLLEGIVRLVCFVEFSAISRKKIEFGSVSRLLRF